MLSTFSFHFLRIFQMTKLELFPPLVDRCLQEPCGRSRPLFALMNPCCAKCVNQLHDFCVSLSCTCCGNALETSHMTSRVCVCVCVRMNFSAIYRLVLCLWIRASQSINRNATTRPVRLNDTPRFMQKQRVRR